MVKPARAQEQLILMIMMILKKSTDTYDNEVTENSGVDNSDDDDDEDTNSEDNSGQNSGDGPSMIPFP